jgi:hypothetical protein
MAEYGGAHNSGTVFKITRFGLACFGFGPGRSKSQPPSRCLSDIATYYRFSKLLGRNMISPSPLII